MGRLVPIAENATNSPAFHGIKNILRKNGVVVDTLYLSNIANFMNDSNKQKALVRSIRNLIDPSTFVISCPRIQGKIALHQVITRGSVILNNSLAVPPTIFDAQTCF